MKKTLIIPLCLLAAGGLGWLLWPEYGSSYSEEQRRLWNERRAVYPVAWIVNGAGIQQEIWNPCSDIAGMTGKTKKEVESVVKGKKEEEAALVRELETNRDRHGPDYKAKDAFSPDTARLPLYGLTEQEIAGRALEGDGDACLKMVQYLCRSAARRGVIDLSWRERHDAEKWLDRAIALKRPGAVFLKTLLKEARDFQKSQGMNRNIISGDHVIFWSKANPASVQGIMLFEMEKLPGYDDFVECLKKGDYYVYRTASGMLPEMDVVREKELMHSVLLKGAEEGRSDHQRDLALLFFEEGVFRNSNLFPHSSMSAYTSQKTWDWNNRLKWLPDSWKIDMIRGVFFCGIIDVEKSPAMKGYREAARYARKAALQGDLTGMYLWMRHGITSMEKYSTREWEDILSYDRILFESGYAPYVERVGKNRRYLSAGKVLDNEILRSYYSVKSYDPFSKKDYLASRNLVWTISSKDTLEEIRKKVQTACQSGMTDWFLESRVIGWGENPGELMSGTSDEVKKYVVELLEEWAAEGDLNALYRLAVIYEKGIGTKADPDRAYALYRKALEGADEYPGFSVSIRDSNGNPSMYEAKSLKYVALLKMAEMVLNHPDFPEREAKEAYDLLLDASRDWLMGDYSYPLLGLFHERGIGRPVDRARAVEFYTKGKSRSQACREGLDRLAPSDVKEKAGSK